MAWLYDFDRIIIALSHANMDDSHATKISKQF
jgi:hypothetical protein